jgi:hypothetical protein
MIVGIIEKIYHTYLEIAPYLFIGLFFAGILHIFFKKDFVAKHLGKNNFFSVVKASVIGVPLPLCSCGVIPTALYLRKQKASKGATISFLISTPQTGVDSIIATYGMLGPVFAIFRPLAAFVTGIVGGSLANLLHKNNHFDEIEDKSHCDACEVNVEEKHSLFYKIKNMFQYAFGEFLDDISLQLLVGISIAGFISYIVPDEFFVRYGGQGFVGMLLMIAVGIPLYVCATSSIPIAASFIMKGISPGAAFVFLVAGPATNAATITLIGRALGKKIVGIYLATIAVFALLGGLALNYVYSLLNINPHHYHIHNHEHGPSFFVQIIIVLFTLFFFLSLFRKMKRKFFPAKIKEDTMQADEKVMQIEGMTCNHCVHHVTEAIKAVTGVENVTVSLAEKRASVKGKFDSEAVKKAIESAGYKVK